MAAVDDVQSIVNNLCAIVKAKTDAWVSAGCPPTYSIDGISVDWVSWLEGMNRSIEGYMKQLQIVGGPFTNIDGRVKG